jgi:hypothetical protein
MSILMMRGSLYLRTRELPDSRQHFSIELSSLRLCALCRSVKTCSSPIENAGPEKNRARRIYLVAGA